MVRRIDAEGVWAVEADSEDSVSLTMDYLQRLIREDHENLQMTPIGANSFSLALNHGWGTVVIKVSEGSLSGEVTP